MRFSECGSLVEEEWRRTRQIRAEVQLDAFLVMPNHIHGIVIIEEPWVSDRMLDAVRMRCAGVWAHGRAPLPITSGP